MTTISSAGSIPGAGTGFLDKERTIATAGFNRWLVPPAALCIHLCIGMAYGFSVFWLPLSRAIGVTAPKACPDMTLEQAIEMTGTDAEPRGEIVDAGAVERAAADQPHGALDGGA